jgi:hypothetical protein
VVDLLQKPGSGGETAQRIGYPLGMSPRISPHLRLDAMRCAPDFTGAREERIAWTVLIFLIALECIPLWAFQFFPSQDGPSHLYNAAVVASYGNAAIYRDYYRLHFPIIGNVLTQLLQVALFHLTPSPETAEKLLLTAYTIVLPVSLLYLLRRVSSQPNTFSLFGIILIPSFFLHMGFWNFCCAIPVLLVALGYYLDHIDRWTARSIFTTGLLGVVLYLSHALAWTVFGMAVVIFEVAYHWPNRKGIGWHLTGHWRRELIPILLLIPPGVLTLTYSLTTDRTLNSVVPQPLRERLRNVFTLKFLHTMSLWDNTLAKLTAALLVLLCLMVVGSRLRQQILIQPAKDMFLVLGLTCAAFGIFGPETIGDGSFIDVRLSLFGWIFLIAWLAAQAWPRWAMVTVLCVVPVIAARALTARMHEYGNWERALQQFKGIGERIRPGSTVLSLETQYGSKNEIDPLLHAVGLFAPRTFIDLRNYEAGTDHFLTRFRRDRSPFDALGTRSGLEQVPPSFNIVRYETQTSGCVDYVLLYQLPGNMSGSITRYENNLRGYQLVYRSELPLSAWLYERPAPCRNGHDGSVANARKSP